MELILTIHVAPVNIIFFLEMDCKKLCFVTYVGSKKIWGERSQPSLPLKDTNSREVIFYFIFFVKRFQ